MLAEFVFGPPQIVPAFSCKMRKSSTCFSIFNHPRSFIISAGSALNGSAAAIIIVVTISRKVTTMSAEFVTFPHIVLVAFRIEELCTRTIFHSFKHPRSFFISANSA